MRNLRRSCPRPLLTGSARFFRFCRPNRSNCVYLSLFRFCRRPLLFFRSCQVDTQRDYRFTKNLGHFAEFRRLRCVWTAGRCVRRACVHAPQTSPETGQNSAARHHPVDLGGVHGVPAHVPTCRVASTLEKPRHEIPRPTFGDGRTAMRETGRRTAARSSSTSRR